jgi:hypothetical protein
MNREKLLQRVSVDPRVCGGKPPIHNGPFKLWLHGTDSVDSTPNRFTLLLWKSFSLTLRGVSVSQDPLLLTLLFLPSSNV